MFQRACGPRHSPALDCHTIHQAHLCCTKHRRLRRAPLLARLLADGSSWPASGRIRSNNSRLQADRRGARSVAGSQPGDRSDWSHEASDPATEPEPAVDWDAAQSQPDDRLDYPDITILTSDEQNEVLPVLPTTEQLRWLEAQDAALGPATWVAALLVFVVAGSRFPLVGVLGGCYPFYSKPLRAVVRNAKRMLSGSNYVGLWHTTLQHARIVQQPITSVSAAQGVPPTPSVVVKVGDSGIDAFSTELEFPWVAGCEELRVGDEVEVLVLSQLLNFSEFKVLRELYFPQSSLFLSEYPFMRRSEFLRIRDDVEVARYGELRTARQNLW